MMINIKLSDILETGNQYTKNLPLAILIGSLFLYVIYTIIPFNFYNEPALYLILKNLIFFNTEFNINNIDSLLFNETNNSNLYYINYIDIYNFINSSKINNYLFNSDVLFTSFLQIQLLGHSLYTNGAILLIILSFILLLAMFAIIIISTTNEPRNK